MMTIEEALAITKDKWAMLEKNKDQMTLEELCHKITSGCGFCKMAAEIRILHGGTSMCDYCPIIDCITGNDVDREREELELLIKTINKQLNSDDYTRRDGCSSL